ncbi:MAG: DNA mismatch repair endonuclease MutL [Coxiellaceae bacterium]|nr:DNA mismatch repair endonuclease MutL [Coxiellaceae bacterium]
MSAIQILDPLLANQIAAGEVVERPASVVKELVENSIDAGSTQITIELQKGGVELIRLRDNGCGISKDDLTLACVRHATSKIASYQDLTEVLSLGFRGEALASIAAVSKLKISSRANGSDDAWQVATSGTEGEVAVMPAAHPVGTTVEIRELFYNTPARRRFLRTDKTEFHHIESIVLRQALSRFDIAFRLSHNDKLMFDLPVADSQAAREQRIQKLLGQDFVQAALAIEYEAAGLKLTGWIASAEYNRAQADQQYCYINGRFIRDKMIMSAVKQAYRDVMFHGRHPAYVLYLQCDPTSVDVNVHPTKHEVRFRDGRTEYRFIMTSIQQALESLRLGGMDVDTDTGEVLTAAAPAVTAPVKPVMQNEVREQVALPLAPGSEAGMTARSADVTARSADVTARSADVTARSADVIARSADVIVPSLDVKNRPAPVMQRSTAQLNDALAKLQQPVTVVVKECAKQPLGVAIAQLHNTYILAQNEEGLIVVDQHAAHERICFETMKQQLAEQAMPSQALLVPVDINLTSTEMLHLEDELSSLQQLGFAIEAMGDTMVVVREIPTLLHKADIAALIKDIAADVQVMSESQRAENHLHCLMANMACKSAIKANHPLTLEEMNHILRQMESIPHGGLCNHGRPAWKQFDKREIDRWFLRGQ